MKPSLKLRIALWGGWFFGLASLAQASAQSPEEAPRSSFVPAPVAISTLVDTVHGLKYRVHVVQRGHTLYSIARAYQVGLHDIRKRSGGDTVRVEEALYIPYKQVDGLAPQQEVFYPEARAFVFPETQPHAMTETPQDEVIAITTITEPASRGSLPESISPADTTVIPSADTVAGTVAPTVFSDTILPVDLSMADSAVMDTLAPDTATASFHYVWGNDTLDWAQTTTEILWDSLFAQLKSKETISVALLLPLYLNDTLDPPVRSYAYLPFMEGWMTALSELVDRPDSLWPKISYQVWDVTDKTESVDRALNDPALAKADFLIAAVYTKVFDTIRRFAQAHRMPLIHPLTEQDSTAAGLPYFVQCLPSYETQADAMARFLQTEFPLERYRYILLDDSTAFYRKRAQQLYARLAPDTNEVYDIWHYSLPAARMGQLETAFESLFAYGSARPTVFIGCTDKEIALLNTLIALRKAPGTAEKIFIGPSRWMSFTKIEPEYFQNIRLICYQPFFWDKNREASMLFERHYFAHFGVLPSDLAFKGYTCFKWFDEMLRTGTVSANPYGRHRWHTRAIGGWENTRVFWLELKDHAFVRWPEPEPELEPEPEVAAESTDGTGTTAEEAGTTVKAKDKKDKAADVEEEGDAADESGRARPKRNRNERK